MGATAPATALLPLLLPLVLTLLVVAAGPLGAPQSPPPPLPRSLVPVALDFEGAASLPFARVTMCGLDWALYRSNPTKYSKLAALASASHCDAPGRSVVVPFHVLMDEYAARGCSAATNTTHPPPGCVPAGLVYHSGAGRGAAVLFDALAGLDSTLAFSETPMEAALLAAAWKLPGGDGEVRAGLAVIAAALGRPIWASEDDPVEAGTWVPRHLYLRVRPAHAARMGLYRAVFPTTPWVFVHKPLDGALAAAFKAAGSVAGASAAALPCVRGGHALAESPFARLLLGEPPHSEVGNASHGWPMASAAAHAAAAALLASRGVEAACAAVLADVYVTALVEAAAARRLALAQLEGGAAALGGASPSPSSALARADDGVLTPSPTPTPTPAWAEEPHWAVHVRDYEAAAVDAQGVYDGVAVGMKASRLISGGGVPLLRLHTGGASGSHVGTLLDGTTCRGVVGGIGQGLLLPDEGSGRETAAVLLEVLRGHLAPPRWRERDKTHGSSGGMKRQRAACRRWLTRSDDAFLAAFAGHHAAAAAAAAVEPLPPHPLSAWPALTSAARRYLLPLEAPFSAFGVPKPRGAADAGEVVLAGTADVTAGGRVRTEAGNGGSAAAALPAVPGVPPAFVRPPSAPHPPLPADVRMLPISGGYPVLYPLGDILTAWSPDVTSVPAHYGRYSSLRVFNGEARRGVGEGGAASVWPFELHLTAQPRSQAATPTASLTMITPTMFAPQCSLYTVCLCLPACPQAPTPPSWWRRRCIGGRSCPLWYKTTPAVLPPWPSGAATPIWLPP